jgi:hypothetical protein
MSTPDAPGAPDGATPDTPDARGAAPGQGGAPEQPAGWGTPSYGPPGYGPAPGAAPQPRYGQYAPGYGPDTPAPGAEQHGQGQYGQGAPGQYGQPRYGQPAPGQYGQPQYGQPAPGQYGPGQYGQPQYGGPAGFGGAPYAPPASKPGIIPLRPLTLGEIFDGSFGAVRSNPRVMLGISAVVISVATVLGLGLGYLASGIVGPALGTVDESIVGTDPFFDDFLTAYLGILSSAVVLGLATPILNGLLIASVSRSVLGRRATPGEVWAQVRSAVWPLIGFSLLSGLVIALAVAVWFGLVVLAASADTGLAVVVGLVGGLALLAGVVWFAVRILFVPPALVLERQGLRSAVVRGWTLSRGSFWRVLGIYLLASIAVGILANIISQPLGLVAGVVLSTSQSATGFLAIMALAQVLSGVVTTVFVAAVTALLYIDVRMRREGLDVELAAAASEQRPA